MKFLKKVIVVIAMSAITSNVALSVTAVTYNSRYDVNNDKKIDVRDVAYINRVLSGTEKPISLNKLDVNQNTIIDDLDKQTK